MKSCKEKVSDLFQHKALYKTKKIKVICGISILLLLTLLAYSYLNPSYNKEHEATQEDIIKNEVIQKESPEAPFQEISQFDSIDVLGNVIVDGVNYLQVSTDMSNYTLDRCLGDVRDYPGSYQSLLKDLSGELYTVLEDHDILVVKLANDGVVVLKKTTDW